MRRNATQTEPAELTPAQDKAIAAMLAGKTVTDAATEAGVDRTTVHRWLKDDLVFQAGFNRGKLEVRQAAQTRLLRLVEAATVTVEAAIVGGDAKLAVDVLKGLGWLDGKLPEIRSDDVDKLERDRRQAALFEFM